jgi:hypothetical protein
LKNVVDHSEPKPEPETEKREETDFFRIKKIYIYFNDIENIKEIYCGVFR